MEARGDLINIVQTAAMVGQEMAMSGRMERGYHQRIFPHFKKNDISLESRGFVAHGFKDGLTPFEFFFDAMNSRESLMDKSLKTRHSGSIFFIWHNKNKYSFRDRNRRSIFFI